MSRVEEVVDSVDRGEPDLVSTVINGPDGSPWSESVSAEARPEPDPDNGGGSVRRPHLARNVAVLFASQLVTWSLTTIVMVVRPRYLGPDGIGQLRLATSLWSIAGVLVTFGTSTLITLMMARDKTDGAGLLHPVVRLRIALWAVSVCGIVTFAIIAYDPTTVAIVAIASVAVLIYQIGEVARSGLYGLQRMPDTARVDVLNGVVLVGVTLGVVAAGGGTPAFAAATAVPATVMAVMLWRALKRAIGPSPVRQRESIKGVIRRGSPYMLLESTQIVYHQMDVVVISLLATTRELGWYATADALFGSLFFVPSILMTALFPVVAQVHAERPEKLDALLQRSFRSLMLLAVPIGLGTVIIAEQVCVLLFGEAFRESGAVLATFGVVVIFEFGNILLGRFAQASNRQRFFNKVMILATVISVPLDLVLVPWTRDTFGNGAIGGGLAFIVTEIMILSLAIWHLAPGLLSRTTLVRVVKCVLSGAAMFLTAWPLRHVFLPVPVIVGAVTYFGVLMALSTLDHDERSALWSLPRRAAEWRRAKS